MWTILKNFLKPPKFEDAEKTLTARVLYSIVLIIIVGNLFTLVAANLISSGPSDNTSLYIASTAVLVVFLTLLGITRLGHISYSGWMLVISSFIGLHYILWHGDGLHDLTILAYPLIIALAGLLLGKRGIVISTILASASMVGLAYAESTGQILPSFSAYDIFYLIRYSAPLFLTAYVLYMTISILVHSRNRAEQNELTAIQKNRELEEVKMSLEQRVIERTTELEESSLKIIKRASQLEAIAALARSIANLQDTEQLLPDITRLISDRFGFYHVGIFLLSENKEFAVLHAANSAGGQIMLARGHRLRVGSEGLVGYATGHAQARIALDVGEDAVYFDNPDLPATRSEIALPLMIGGDVIGALDVQSEEPKAFSDEDIRVLTTLADQVSVAIQNARLFEKSQQVAKELENTLQRYIRRDWSQFSNASLLKGYKASRDGLEPISGETQSGSEPAETGYLYKVPVVLRGVSIGSLDINLEKHIEEYTQEEREIIQATADRIALALESARLLEESQKRASKEQIIGDISTRIGSSIDLRNVLQTAVEELGRNIPGSEIVIELKSQQPKAESFISGEIQ